MQHGKRPTRKQKIYLEARGYHHDQWLVIRDTNQVMVIKCRAGGTIQRIEKP